MTATDILQELQTMGSENTKRIFRNHGAPEPLFGVKVGDLKKIVQRVKKDHDLSLALYDTGKRKWRVAKKGWEGKNARLLPLHLPPCHHCLPDKNRDVALLHLHVAFLPFIV